MGLSERCVRNSFQNTLRQLLVSIKTEYNKSPHCTYTVLVREHICQRIYLIFVSSVVVSSCCPEYFRYTVCAQVLVLENDNQMAKLASMPLEEMKLEVVVQYTGKPRLPAVARASSTPSTPSTPVPVANGSAMLPNGALGTGTDSPLKDLSPQGAAVAPVANGEVKSASTTSETSTSVERPNSTSPSPDSGRTQSPTSNAHGKGPRFMDVCHCKRYTSTMYIVPHALYE